MLNSSATRTRSDLFSKLASLVARVGRCEVSGYTWLDRVHVPQAWKRVKEAAAKVHDAKVTEEPTLSREKVPDLEELVNLRNLAEDVLGQQKSVYTQRKIAEWRRRLLESKKKGASELFKKIR